MRIFIGLLLFASITRLFLFLLPAETITTAQFFGALCGYCTAIIVTAYLVVTWRVSDGVVPRARLLK